MKQIEPAAQAQGGEATADTSHKRAEGVLALTIGSVGVVYGDIGTSPLYAFHESIVAATGEHSPITEPIVLGVLSLIIWALLVIVTAKYILILLRADNHGEGGTLALMALASKALSRSAGAIILLGIISGALFYGDAIITPALSVMSAIEGIKILTPALSDYVVPITAVILIALLSMQWRGTAKVAAFFGPITLLWFAALAAAGIWQIAAAPVVLYAFSPWYGLSFLVEHGGVAFLTLGAVFLVVTGSEALYADLGHFGRTPIRLAWLAIVLPSLTINYLGQGALVLANPKAVENTFFLMFPNWALIPMLVLSTVATVIASQAVITGAYSMTQQAIQLGLLPRLEIRHTSATLFGQIYMPVVNWLLLLGVLLLVGLFRSSSALAAAYGIAVTGTMVVTAMMAFIVIWRVWGWSRTAAAALIVPFLLIDFVFLSANLLKVLEGGWLPLAMGGVIMTIMYSWRRGTRLLLQKTRRQEIPIQSLVTTLERKPPNMVPGTAVFLTSDPEFAPTALLHNLKHNKVLHEQNVVLTVLTDNMPRVPEDRRVEMVPISPHFLQLKLHFGFMEQPNVPRALALARKLGWHFDIMSTSFFLSRRLLRPAANSEMPRWQDRLYVTLTKIANDATNYFQIPTGRVVEVGTQVTV